MYCNITLQCNIVKYNTHIFIYYDIKLNMMLYIYYVLYIYICFIYDKYMYDIYIYICDITLQYNIVIVKYNTHIYIYNIYV